MSELRLRRRLAGFLRKRLRELHLDDVADARDRRGRRWELRTLLEAMVIGLTAGAQGLGEVEEVTDTMTLQMRHWLGIPRRIPDTTLRDALLTIDPQLLRPALHRAVRVAMST